MITCLKKNIKLEHYNENLNDQNVDLTLDNELIADYLNHGHETTTNLINKFGNNYDIVSIKRNKYETFISLYKHVIDEIYRHGDSKLVKTLKSFDENDLFLFNPDIINDSEDFSNKLSELFNTPRNSVYNEHSLNILKILFSHNSHYHNNYPTIKWFDFTKLNEFEEWVSNKLSKTFKLEKINSSQHFNCKLQNNENFRKKYDEFYYRFENYKKIKTLL
jgi:hypothetical protein